MKSYIPLRFPFLLAVFLLMPLVLFADSYEIQDCNGGVDYTHHAQALSDMTTNILAVTGYAVSIIYAIASLLSVYNATVIYIKLQTGEGGFTKSVLMLVGSALFILSATLVMPAFFGFTDFSTR